MPILRLIGDDWPKESKISFSYDPNKAIKDYRANLMKLLSLRNIRDYTFWHVAADGEGPDMERDPLVLEWKWSDYGFQPNMFVYLRKSQPGDRKADPNAKPSPPKPPTPPAAEKEPAEKEKEKEGNKAPSTVIHLIGDRWIKEHRKVLALKPAEAIAKYLATISKKLEVTVTPEGMGREGAVGEWEIWPTEDNGMRPDVAKGPFDPLATWETCGVKHKSIIYVRQRKEDTPAPAPPRPATPPPSLAPSNPMSAPKSDAAPTVESAGGALATPDPVPAASPAPAAAPVTATAVVEAVEARPQEEMTPSAAPVPPCAATPEAAPQLSAAPPDFSAGSVVSVPPHSEAPPPPSIPTPAEEPMPQTAIANALALGSQPSAMEGALGVPHSHSHLVPAAHVNSKSAAGAAEAAALRAQIAALEGRIVAMEAKERVRAEQDAALMHTMGFPAPGSWATSASGGELSTRARISGPAATDHHHSGVGLLTADGAGRADGLAYAYGGSADASSGRFVAHDRLYPHSGQQEWAVSAGAYHSPQRPHYYVGGAPSPTHGGVPFVADDGLRQGVEAQLAEMERSAQRRRQHTSAAVALYEMARYRHGSGVGYTPY